MSTFYQGSASETIQKQRTADVASAAPANFVQNEFGGQAGRTVPSVQALTGMTAITFPAGLGDDPAAPVFMTYLPKKITSAVGGTMGDMSFQSVSVTKDNIAQVALPIPTGINVAYAQGWDATDVNAVQGAVMNSAAFKGAASAVKGAAEGTVTGQDAMDVVGVAAQKAVNLGESIISGVKDAGAAAIAAGGTGTINMMMNKISAVGMSGNAIAGVTAGVAGKLLGPAMSTAAGFSSFNQTMAHYNGPAFRNFNFTYTLRPLSAKDQQNIVKIVNFFKIASAPSQISNGLFRIYETPYIFKIGFFSREGELKDVNRIAHCACTNVSVSYGGDRFQTFSGTNSPVETNIALTFKEIELITRTEMEEGY